MRKLYFLTVACLITIWGLGQSKPLLPGAEKCKYQDYIIRIIPGPDRSMGYDVIKDNKVLVHQIRNPFGDVHHTLNSAEARTVAFYVIDEFKKTGRWATSLNEADAEKLSLRNQSSKP